MKWRVLGLGLVAACGDDAGSKRDLDAMVLVASDAQRDAPDGASCTAVEQTLPVASAFHVLGDIMYSDPPPVGGDHNPCWATWGVHDAAVPDENWVHNLEHGGVVFLYNCPAGCSDEVDALKAYVRASERTVLTPYAQLPTRFAAVAWGVRATSDCLDLPGFMQFYTEHVGHGPENVSGDPPRSCN